jgi:tryptophan-rich sensory protein
MGTASWLIWREGGWEQQALPLALYSLQLAFNMAWSPLFFGAHKMVRRAS